MPCSLGRGWKQTMDEFHLQLRRDSMKSRMKKEDENLRTHPEGDLKKTHHPFN